MPINKDDVLKNKQEALDKINSYIDNCLTQDEKHIKKANLISYWLKDYFQYIEYEENFNSALLKEYHYGDVIKVNLGFNVGNEEGGLHYCVVLDKHNAKQHSTLTVIPLTSVKPHSKPNKASVPIGNEVYNNIVTKSKKILDTIDKEKAISFQDKIVSMYKGTYKNITDDEIAAVEDYNKKAPLILKILDEVEQMKKGSIAHINQITTISKQRIYDPKNDLDVLADIKLSDEKMKLISNKIKKFYTI